jgi:hypothetical protein
MGNATMNNNNDPIGNVRDVPIKQSNVLDLWASKIPEVVTQWLPKMQLKEKNAYALYRYCQWAKKTPTELLKLKENPASKDAEKLLDTFNATELVDLHMTNADKCWSVNAVKSFFKHNYCDLARASGVCSFEKVKPYNKPSKEELRKLWNYAYNPRDKSLLTLVCSTAIAKETLSEIKWKHLEDNWEKVELPCINLPSELVKGHGKGKYKGVRQTTFLTPEAKRDLITYKEWIEKKMGRSVTPEDHIFVATYAPYHPASYSALGWNIWQIAKRAGVKFSLHDARRHVETALEEVKIHPNWARKIRGRKVRGEEAPYSQPAIEDLRKIYRQAVPLLQFTIEPLIPKDVQEKLAALEAEQIELKRKYGIYRQRARKPKRKTATDGGDCTNGQHCQKIVSEDDLSELLADGWVFIATLPSGKILVGNDT